MPQTAAEADSRRKYHHQSGVDTILGCPRRWWLENEAGIVQPAKPTAAAGTAYHTALEAHERARLDGNPGGVTEEEMLTIAYADLDEMLPHFDAEALAGVKVPLPKARKKRGEDAPVQEYLYGIDALKDKARCAIRNFWHGVTEDGVTPREWLLRFTPLAVELYARAALAEGCRDLAGTLDWVGLDPDGNPCIIDHKTTGDLGYWKEPREHAAQATHYGALLLLDPNLDEVSEHLPATTLPPTHYLVVRTSLAARETTKTALVQTLQPTMQDVADLGANVREAERIREEGLFPRNEAYKWCKAFSCPFYSECVGGGPLSKAPSIVLVTLALRQEQARV